MGGKSSAPPPPNYAPVAASTDHAADMAYQAAQNQLNFYKQTYADQLPREQQLYDLATNVANQQMGLADQSNQRANDQWNYYKNTFMPNELQTAADAYGSQYLNQGDNAQLTGLLSGKSGLPADQVQAQLQQLSQKAQTSAGNQAASNAAADINSSYAQQARALTRMGGDPNRIAAAAAQIANAQSLARIGASNQARQSLIGQQQGMRANVANFGRNMPNTTAQNVGLAMQGGNAAVANQNSAFMSNLPYTQMVGGAYNTGLGAAGIGMQGGLGMGSVLNQGYSTQMQGYQADQQANAGAMQGIGSLAMAGAIAF